MYTINNLVENIYEIKKSKFIAKIYYINTEDEKNIILNGIKKEYSDARHICYYYKIDEKEHSTDDKEPSGTFTKPAIEYVKNKKINHILIVVIRYFGGIKLGAGGLMRAYSTSISQAFNIAKLVELKKGYLIEIKTAYENIKKLDYITKQNQFIEKDFGNEIIYKLYVTKDELNNLMEYNPKILLETYIKK